MDLQKIYSDSDFENAVVPEGQILVFNGTENGKPVTRYKDSSGNFGTIAGGEGGSGSVDVTLGQIDADGNFQALSFSGTEASNSGDPETVESYYGWNGTLKVPDKGIKVGEATEYYKCASVDTTSKTWTGYLAILTDGVYTFEETVTEGLTYGTAFTPVTGRIYNAEATVAVSGLYEGSDPNLVFYAPLIGSSTAAETGQVMTETGTVQYTTFGGRDCAYFDGSSKVAVTDLTDIPTGGQPHTIAMWLNYSRFTSYQGLFGMGYEYAIRSMNSAGECDLVYYTSLGGAFNYTLTANTWYHIATTCDGSTAKLYIDGVQTATQSDTPDFDFSRYPEINIGAVPRTGNATGYVSDVRIYNRCLTAEEIAELANN